MKERRDNFYNDIYSSYKSEGTSKRYNQPSTQRDRYVKYDKYNKHDKYDKYNTYGYNIKNDIEKIGTRGSHIDIRRPCITFGCMDEFKSEPQYSNKKLTYKEQELKKIEPMDKEFEEFTVNRYYLSGSHIKDKELLDNFIIWLTKNFGLRNYKREIYKCLNEECSDFDLYNIFLNGKKQDYEATFKNKISILDNMLKSVTSEKINNILDVGTENLIFLQEMEENFKTPAYGINIDKGYCHYDDAFMKLKEYEKFNVYNGVDILYSDKFFDLLTIYNVLHHVENIAPLIQEICRVCKKYVFIKDVDLTSDVKEMLFIVQHELYESVIERQGKSYLNRNSTYKNIEKEFSKCGFYPQIFKSSQNFNGTFHVLFVKD